MDIPLCQSEHKPQLLLNDPAAISLYHTAPEKFAGALAPNAELCDAWAEELAPLPVGLALECPPEPDAEHCERPITMHYIEQCKEVFRPLLHDDAAFYYLHGAPTFPALRAAVLALGDLCGRTVIAELHVEDDEGHLPDGTEPDSQKACEEYNKVIASMGGVDLQLLGLGHDGHIGFNEPNDEFDKETHCVDLTEMTIEANKRFFNSIDEVPRQAYTMGIATIMRAKCVLMVVSGKDKAEILKKSFFGPITPQVPASILQLHPNFVLIADEDALSAL